MVGVVAFTGALYALSPEIGDLYLRRYARVAPPVCANPETATSHRAECLWFDRHTGRRLGADRGRDPNAGDRLRSMTYDIHTGRIAGIPGRLIVFLASLVAASLPVTGALVWWNRR